MQLRNAVPVSLDGYVLSVSQFRWLALSVFVGMAEILESKRLLPSVCQEIPQPFILDLIGVKAFEGEHILLLFATEGDDLLCGF